MPTYYLEHAAIFLNDLAKKNRQSAGDFSDIWRAEPWSQPAEVRVSARAAAGTAAAGSRAADRTLDSFSIRQSSRVVKQQSEHDGRRR